MNAREVLVSVTGFCDACGAGPGVVCDPFCVGVAAEQDEPCKVCESRVCVVCARPGCHVPTCVECDSPSIWTTVKGRPYCYNCLVCAP